MSDNSVAVLDIRSSELAVFVGERGVNHTFVFKASRTESYSGYEDGKFFDVEELSAAVLRAVAAVEQICGEKLRRLYVGVPGEFTKVEPREQVVSFPKRVRITAKELDDLFQSGKSKIKGFRFMRVTSMIYVTADNRRVANPIGLYSTGLSGVLSYFYCSNYFVNTLRHIFEGYPKLELKFLPTQFAMASYLISPETRDEYALFLDVGFLSSTLCVLLGNGILVQESYWAGRGQIAVRLMQKFSLPYEAALALLGKSNLYLKQEAKNREFLFDGVSYEIPVRELTEEIKAGLDELCESVGAFMEMCSGKELESKPLYLSGEGLDGIRGAVEHLSKRLSCSCELIAPDLPYFNKPSMSSRIALMNMACNDNRSQGGILKRILNVFGG